MIYRILKAFDSCNDVTNIDITKKNDSLIVDALLKNSSHSAFNKTLNDLQTTYAIDSNIDGNHATLTITNKTDVDRRNELMNIKSLKSIAEFKHMNVDMVNELVKMPFGIDLNFKGKYAPQQSMFVDWMNKHPEFKASGFVTAGNRDDCGVYIDSIEAMLDAKHADDIIKELKETFAEPNGFVNAKSEDEKKTYVCCWYD